MAKDVIPTADDPIREVLRGRPEVARLIELMGKRPLALGDYHAIGTQVLKLYQVPELPSHGDWKPALAGLLGCSTSTLNKAVQFSKAYAPGELQPLLDLQAGWNRTAVSLGLADRERRHELLRKAREANWTDRDVHRAIQEMLGKRRGGGRPRRKAVPGQGVLAELSELSSLTRAWVSFVRSALIPDRERLLAEATTLADKPGHDVQKLVLQGQETLEEMRRLTDDVEAALEELGELLARPPSPG